MFKCKSPKLTILVDFSGSINRTITEDMLNFAGWESVGAIQHNQYLREVEVYPFTGDIYEDAKVTITPSDNPNAAIKKLDSFKESYFNGGTEISTAIESVDEGQPIIVLTDDCYNHDIADAGDNVFFVIFKENPIYFLESEEFYTLLDFHNKNIAIKLCSSYKTH